MQLHLVVLLRIAEIRRFHRPSVYVRDPIVLEARWLNRLLRRLGNARCGRQERGNRQVDPEANVR